MIADSLGLFLGDEFCSGYAALGTCLVEEVDQRTAQTQSLVHLPVDTSEGLPVSLEVISLIDVGIGLAEIAEAGPHLDVLGNHVTGIELYEHLGYLGHSIACCIDLAHISVAEGNGGLKLLVSRLLISEQEMEVEALEGMQYSIGGPSPCLYVVGQRSGLDLTSVLEVEGGVVVGL